MLLSTLHRLAFYGVILGACIGFAEVVDITLLGGQLWMVFAAVSAISGVIHTANISALNKLTDIEKNSALGYWAKLRLKSKTDIRRSAATARAAFGLILAVIAAAFTGYMKLNETNVLAGWVIGSTVFCILLSVVMAAITIIEAFHLSHFESNLLMLQSREKAKQDAKLSINTEPEEK